jgi:hypothetical protein
LFVWSQIIAGALLPHQPMRQSKSRLGVQLTRVYQCLSECGSIGERKGHS